MRRSSYLLIMLIKYALALSIDAVVLSGADIDVIAEYYPRGMSKISFLLTWFAGHAGVFLIANLVGAFLLHLRAFRDEYSTCRGFPRPGLP